MERWVAETRRPDPRDLRGTRRGRQGRRDQTDHRAPEPARHPPHRVAEADRTRAHAVVLPALHGQPAGRRRDRAVRPVLVQPRRRRARARLLHAAGVPGVPPAMSDLRAPPGRGRDPADQVLVLRLRRGAGAAVPQARRRSDAPMEALRDRPLRADALDRLLTGEGRDVRAHRHPGRAVARRRGRRQEAGAHQLHRASALDGAVDPEAGAEDRPAAPAVRRRLHAPAARPVLRTSPTTRRRSSIRGRRSRDDRRPSGRHRPPRC